MESPAIGDDLECLELVKRFGAFVAVDRVSFRVPQGRFFSILGPSGCGKTTLLRMLAGFAQPDSGDIRITQRSVLNLPPNQRPCNMVFQHLALFPNMSVGENIAYGLKRRGVGRAAREEKVAAMLQRIGLPDAGGKRISQLSGGQKQRVAIARCLVLEPAVLLLDEPLGALDLKLREHMKVELKSLQEKFGTTFVYITHDQSEALVMSDQVAVMNHGRFEQVGSPRELYEQPATAFVAGFVGESNVFDVCVGSHGPIAVEFVSRGGLSLPVPEALVPRTGGRAQPDSRILPAAVGGGLLPGASTAPHEEGGTWRLFLRPEAITLCRDPAQFSTVTLDPGAQAGSGSDSPGGEVCHSGRIESLLSDGARSQVRMRRVGSVETLDILVPHSQDLADCHKGQTVGVSWKPASCRVFRVAE